MKPKVLLSSKITIITLLALLLFLGSLKYRQWQGQQAIENLKISLEQQAGAAEKKNQELQQSISFLNSADFKERVARSELNLKKDGELVYNFSPVSENSNSQAGAAAPSQTNPQKWWNYFFGKN